MKRHIVLVGIIAFLAMPAELSLAQDQNTTKTSPKLESPIVTPAQNESNTKTDPKKSGANEKTAATNKNTPLSKQGSTPDVKSLPSATPPDVMGPNDPRAVESRNVGANPNASPIYEDPENLVVRQDDLGMLSWITNPFIFGFVALLLILTLALHVYQLLKTTQMSRDLAQVMGRQQRQAQANQVAGQSGKNAMIDSLSEQINKQNQGLGQLTTRLNQMENRLTLGDSHAADTIQALGVASSWIGHSKLQESAAADGGKINEDQRNALVSVLERYKEPLRINASRVEPVAQAMAAFIEQIEDRAHLSPELVGRVQKLYQDIGRFDQWYMNANGQLASLQRGSFSQRSTMLQSEQQRLVEQARSGSISVAQMVQKSRDLLEQYFPDGASQNGNEVMSPNESEAELKKVVADAPNYLMEWFNSLFQLQNQLLSAGARSAIESEIFNELVQIQKIAQEVLGRFDIQLETIQVGQTNYDRRLHEATMVRQSSQFPTNTVIEVHRCGFRRMSTGEVLRRPEVVVAGAAVS